MQKILFETGIKKFEINEGKILRFNPSDINLYKRFIDAKDELLGVEKRLVERAAAEGDAVNGERVIAMLSEADTEMKAIFNRVFGNGNDFHDIFEGVNLLSVAANGERVVTNFLNAVLPIIEDGAKKAAHTQAAMDVAKIKGNRAARRARK